MLLFEEGYQNLIKLAEDLHNNKALRDVVSKDLLKDLIFNWIKANYKQDSKSSMSEYVLTECERQIQELEIWIPDVAIKAV